MAEFPLQMPTLMPPPGGLRRLRASIGQAREQTTPGFAEWAALGSIAAVIVLLWWIQQARPQQVALTNLQPLAPVHLAVDGGAVQALPSPSKNVQIYLVMQSATDDSTLKAN